VLETSVATNPELPMSRTNLGLVLFELGEIDRAISESKLAIELGDLCGEAEANLGRCYLAQGDPARAREMFEAALQLSSPGEWAYDTAVEFGAKVD